MTVIFFIRIGRSKDVYISVLFHLERYLPPSLLTHRAHVLMNYLKNGKQRKMTQRESKS